MEKDFWFAAKRYGWGWTWPTRWQGWLVLAVYVAALLAGIFALGPRHPLVGPFIAGLTAVLILICWWKGEPPRWRWGEKK